MAGGGAPDGARYSIFIGSIFVFNLIVGAGALSLPQAFAKAGTIAGEWERDFFFSGFTARLLAAHSARCLSALLLGLPVVHVGDLHGGGHVPGQRVPQKVRVCQQFTAR
jgi:hypothetical protein